MVLICLLKTSVMIVSKVITMSSIILYVYISQRKKRGVIYDGEEEEEGQEEVKVEGDKCGNGGMDDRSATAAHQQENDSSNHPVWKMKLIGNTPPRKQYDNINMYVTWYEKAGLMRTQNLTTFFYLKIK